MSLTEMQKVVIRGTLGYNLEFLNELPEDKKAQALTALELMQKDNLSAEEIDALKSWKNSNIANDNSLTDVNVVQKFLHDDEIVKNLNLVRKDKDAEGHYPPVTKEEVREYMKEQLNQHATKLREEGIEAIKIEPTLYQATQNLLYEQAGGRKLVEAAKKADLKDVGFGIMGLTGAAGMSVVFTSMLEHYNATTTKDLAKHLTDLYSTHSGLSLITAEFKTLQVITKSAQSITETLTALAENGNIRGLTAVLEHIADPNNKLLKRISSIERYKEILNNIIKQEQLNNPNPKVTEAIKVIKKHVETLDTMATEKLQAEEKEDRRIARVRAGRNRAFDQETATLGGGQASTAIGSSPTQPAIAATGSSNTVAQTQNNPTAAIQPTSSISTENTVNTILATAVVLRLCGMDKFAKFSLPPVPIEVQYDYKLPDNRWTPGEFDQLLHTDPKAQIIANTVQNEIQRSGNKEWTAADITAFVTGPNFKKAMEQAEAMEASLRPVTEADLGIEPAKKGTNQPTQKQTIPKHQKSHKKGR